MEKSLKITGENIQVSDGYHTFEELYDHRIALWIALCKEIAKQATDSETLKNWIWRTKLHSDGTSFAGWFILGMGQRTGEQITYHLPLTIGDGPLLESVWEKCNFAETLERAPEFDGHTSADVLERLMDL